MVLDTNHVIKALRKMVGGPSTHHPSDHPCHEVKLVKLEAGGVPVAWAH